MNLPEPAEHGYYWVRLKWEPEIWVPAQLHGSIRLVWDTIGSDFTADDEVVEIGPKIEPPK